MRIADKMQFNQTLQNVGKNRSEMSDLQNQAATLKRVTKPSDDPLAAARVLTQRTEQKGNEQFVKNINNAKSFLEFTDQSLSELSELLTRAKELALSQANDAGGSHQTRLVTASEIEQIYNQSILIGNRKLGEKYIFGGFKTQTQPFNQVGEYSGDDGDMKIMTQKDGFVAMNLSGSKVFLGKGVGSDGIVRARYETPRTVEELKSFQEEEIQRDQLNQEIEQNYIETRGPASVHVNMDQVDEPIEESSGVNLFKSLKGLEISLKTNDKNGVQESLDILDQALNQVILARAELGSRIMTINNTTESLQKAIVDNKAMASQLEDADMFQVVNDIQKTDSTLKASLETSGKLIQPSLLDFLK